MNFKPIGARILIQRVEETTKTASGIIIPDNNKEKPLEGLVLAISEEVAEDNEIKVDDKVVFAKYSGTEITINGAEYLILSIDDVLGILK
jgi:chaperonin GroES